MAIKDIGKELKSSLHDTADAVKEKVKNIDTAEVKENIHSKVDAVKEKVKKIDTAEVKENIHDALETVKDKVVQTGGKAKDKIAETGSKANEQIKQRLQKKDTPTERPERDFSSIPVKTALKVIYYLMAADGEIFHGEEEKFDAIGKELDPNFAQNKAAIVDECKAKLALVESTDEDYADALRSNVALAIFSDEAEEPFIPSKLLIWDLLTVAYSDECFDKSEQSLIDYIVRILQLDKAVYLELQNSILTMFELKKELTWIKTTDRPYLKIELHVNEINNRKAAIMQSVLALINIEEV